MPNTLANTLLFPFADFWWLYAGFSLFVLAMLALDLGVFHRKAHEVSFKEAAGWSAAWFSLALLFNFGLYQFSLWQFAQDPRLLAAGVDVAVVAKQTALEFLTGFIIEKALAIDNIFIFVMIFSYFRVPKIYQHRVLFFGIIGALIFRAGFIAVGAALMKYHVVLLVFGAFLVITGVKMLFTSDKEKDPGQNFALRLLQRWIPVTKDFHGSKFFVFENGKRLATPLLLVLIFIELSDIVFALDSVPAIFAITKEPLIVFTSNIFAILGLRSLYFLLANVLDRFHLIKYGLALVLVFVGLKMSWLNDLYDGKFPISWSLGIIALLIGGSIVLSLLIKPGPGADDQAAKPQV